MNWEDYLYYDEGSPSGLRWRVERSTGKDGRVKLVSAGDVAGCIDNDYKTTLKYWRVGLDNELYSAHRIVWELLNGEIKDGSTVDHVDGNGLNNIASNLRLVSHTSNMRNKVKDKRNTSGVTGVSMDRTYWRGQFIETYWRGQFIDLNGGRVRKSFSIKLYGHDEAFRLACEWRKKMIEQLNTQGAGYTERHGT